MTEAEIDKKWENTPWDTDIYLDDIDDWGVCKDCALKENCAEYKPYKRQCEDYERYQEVFTNEEWLRQCTTEQLAEFLTKVILDDKRFRMTMVGGVNETKLWLKQPHTNE